MTKRNRNRGNNLNNLHTSKIEKQTESARNKNIKQSLFKIPYLDKVWPNDKCDENPGFSNELLNKSRKFTIISIL